MMLQSLVLSRPESPLFSNSAPPIPIRSLLAFICVAIVQLRRISDSFNIGVIARKNYAVNFCPQPASLSIQGPVKEILALGEHYL